MQRRFVHTILMLLACARLSSFAQNTDSLRKLTNVTYPDTQRVSASYQLFRYYLKTGNHDSLQLYNNLIYSLYKNTGDPMTYAYYMNNLGSLQQNNGSYDSAIYYHEQALKYRIRSGQEWYVAQSYNNLGNVYTNKGDPQKALESHEKALAIRKKLGDKRGIGQSLYNIGNLKVSMSLYNDALDHYHEALKSGEETGYRELIANTYNAIGNIYNTTMELAKAKRYFQDGLAIAREQNDKKLTAMFLGNLANVFYYETDTTKAEQLWFEALDIQKQLNNKYSMSVLYNSLGKMEMDRKNYAKALEYYDIALRYSEEIGARENAASVLLNNGSLNLQNKNFAKALEFGKKGLKIAEEIEALRYIVDFHKLIALSYRGLNQYKEAYDEYILWGNLNDSLVQVTNFRELAVKEMRANYEKEQAVRKAEEEKKAAVAEEEAKKERWIKVALIGLFSFVLIIALIVFRSYRQKSRDNKIILSQKAEVEMQKQIVEEKSNMLEEKNKEITDSIRYAKRLQEAILPHEELIKNYLPDSFILYLPKDIIAGDFYWFEVIEVNGAKEILFAACDCTGHGVPGAMVSVVCSNALNRAVKEFNLTEPGVILDKCRELVLETFSQSEKDVKDGMDVSLIRIGVKSSGATQIKWAGANNPLWYTTDDGMVQITANKQAIGKTDDPQPFTTHELQLPKDTQLYLFTDGFADQFGGDKGKKFKYKPMQQLLLSTSGMEPAEQHSLLKKTFMKWKGNLEQVDDVCVIGIKI